MANEHIGRLEKVGLGKESTPGTGVAATFWLPKEESLFLPKTEKAKDLGAYGIIDELYDSQTVLQMTEVSIKGILREVYGGNFLLAALGTEQLCLKITRTGGSGVFVVGETVTGGTSTATGVIRRLDSQALFYITVTTGTFAASETLTGGTSAATGTCTHNSALRTHLFTRLNSNNHPSYTLYGVDDVGTFRSTYCLLESLELACEVGKYLTYDTKWMGKKEASTSATPSFATDENHFLAKHGVLKLATALSGLTAASATEIKSFKMSIQKNLEAYQAFGSDDLASIHNKQFSVSGEITGLFKSSVLKDLNAASTKRAMRMEFTNSDAVIGSTGNPILTIEFARCSFENWTKKSGNDELVMETIGFTAEFSASAGETMAILLQNARTTVY
jgi:hypothetical protein